MIIDKASLKFGCADAALYIDFCARATHRVCPTAERLVADYLAAHREHPTVVLDLSGCAWIDSTFAGWMLGVRKRVARDGGLKLVGCTDRCRSSIERLKMADMFHFGDVERPTSLQTIDCPAAGKPDRGTVELMLRAHEELAGLDEKNRAAFAPIVDQLRRELQATSS